MWQNNRIIYHALDSLVKTFLTIQNYNVSNLHLLTPFPNQYILGDTMKNDIYS